MFSRFRYTLKYIKYFLYAKHKKGHGIHSPFVYELISEVFRNKNKDQELKQLFLIHKKYLKSKELVEYKEIGAGSSYTIKNKLSVRKIIQRSSISPKYGKLIYHLIKYLNPHDILELGSSVGISTAYIAQADPKCNFKSIEGVVEKLKVAKEISLELNQNTEFIHGDFDKVLDTVLNSYEKLDLVFFDGNHRKQSTLNYFNLCLHKAHNNSIFIFDDIYWSKEMEEAWNIIKNNKKVKISIDIFRMGLIFFKKGLSYQQYVIKF